MRAARTQITTALHSFRAGWQGPAADTFFAHMDADIDPAMERLLAALGLLSEAFVTLGTDLRQTEEDAAALFNLWAGLPPDSDTDANPDVTRGGLTVGHTDEQGHLIDDEDGIPPVDMVAIRAAREVAAREAAIAEVEAALTTEFGTVTLNVDPALSPEERLAVLQQVYADLSALKAYNVALTGAAWAPAEIALVREAVERAGATAFHHAQRHEYVPGRVTNAQDAFQRVYMGARVDQTTGELNPNMLTVERVATNGAALRRDDRNYYAYKSGHTIQLSDRAFVPGTLEANRSIGFTPLQLIAHELGHLIQGRYTSVQTYLFTVDTQTSGYTFAARSNPSVEEAYADIVAASTLPGSYTQDEVGQSRQTLAYYVWGLVLVGAFGQ